MSESVSQAPPASPTSTGAPGRRRVMGPLDLVLFTVTAMLVVDQLTATASIGVSAMGWWVVALVLFLIPSGMITAELGTTYPDQGGIYVWVQKAFGRYWAARTTYWYWVNVALWMPSVFLLFSGVFAELFMEDMGKWPRTLIAIGLVWLVVLVGAQVLDIGKWFNNLGAVFKVAIILALGVGGIWLAVRDGAANDFAAGDLMPSMSAAKMFLPVLVFQLLGFELMSSMGGEIKDPARHIPRAILCAGAIIGGLYVLGTLGILLALPVADIELVAGPVQTLKAVFGESTWGDVLVYTLGVATLYTFFANMTTWTMGANRAAAEAAAEGELPALLGREHPRRHTPVAAFVVSGLVATVVLLFTTVVLNENDTLYYAIFAASSVIFLMPYLLMYPGFLVMRHRDPATPRPYRVPGGAPFAWIVTLLSTAFIAASVVLFIWVPGEPVDWGYTGSLLTIVVLALLAGEVIVWWCLGHRHRHPRPTPAGPHHLPPATPA